MSEGIVAAGYCLLALGYFVWEGCKCCFQGMFRCCQLSKNNRNRDVIAAQLST
jgi:hypothetical protein